MTSPTSPVEKLAALAIRVAIETPYPFSYGTRRCYVTNDLVAAIRWELDQAGVDWRAMKGVTKCAP